MTRAAIEHAPSVAASVPCSGNVQNLGEALEASFRFCADTTRAHAKNFYHGMRLAPKRKRAELYAVYAWMRAADDCVDDAPDDASAADALGAFERETCRWLDGHATTAHVDQAGPTLWPAFAATVERTGIDRAVLRGMIRGQASDIGRDAIRTEAELTGYCADVAGTVGVACLAVWGVKRGMNAEHAHTLAQRRGQAFQRTNILRDLGQDLRAARPRCYLPSERLSRYGLMARDVLDPANRGPVIALVSDSAQEARSLYDATADFDSLVCTDCAPVSRTMTRIYQGVLDQIIRDPARVLQPEGVGLSTRRKLALGLLGLAERWVRR